MRPLFLCALLSAATAAAQAQETLSAATLERQLLAEGAAVLARDALAQGDPVRGAILFYQPYLTCTKCHAAGEGLTQALGPDLARPEKQDDLVKRRIRPDIDQSQHLRAD